MKSDEGKILEATTEELYKMLKNKKEVVVPKTPFPRIKLNDLECMALDNFEPIYKDSIDHKDFKNKNKGEYYYFTRYGKKPHTAFDYSDKEKEIYLNEINTVPGSLAYYLFTETLAGFEKILEKNILLACFNKAKQNTYDKKFSCKVLDGVGIKGNKRL